MERNNNYEEKRRAGAGRWKAFFGTKRRAAVLAGVVIAAAALAALYRGRPAGPVVGTPSAGMMESAGTDEGQEEALDLHDLPSESHVSYDHYYVSGATVEEIRDEIYDSRNGKGILNSETRLRSAGSCDWAYMWQADHDWKGATVRFKNVRLCLTMVVTLPKRNQNAVMDRKTTQRWDSFTGDLRAHEAGHVRLCNEQLQVLRLRLSNLQANSEQALTKNANAAFIAFVNDVKKMHEAFDASNGNMGCFTRAALE